MSAYRSVELAGLPVPMLSGYSLLADTEASLVDTFSSKEQKHSHQTLRQFIGAKRKSGRLPSEHSPYSLLSYSPPLRIPGVKHTTLFACLCVFLLTAVVCRGTTNLISTVKSFLEHPPAMQHLTFLIRGTGRGGKSSFLMNGNLFFARVQGDSFTLAELRKPDEILLMSDRRTLPIVGESASSRWAIMGDELYVESTNTSQFDRRDNALRLSQGLEPFLDQVMNLGIYHADRGTLTVDEAGHFAGAIANRLLFWGPGSRILGHFAISKSGRLETATWKVSSKPGVAFNIKYTYHTTNEFAFPPSGWESWAVRDGHALTTDRVDILEFARPTSTLPEDAFSPAQFMNQTNKALLGPLGPIILTRVKGRTLWFRNGAFEDVPVAEGGPTRRKTLFEVILIAFALAGVWNMIHRHSQVRNAEEGVTPVGGKQRDNI